MDVDGPGGIPSPGTEEGTIARKRSRRVSFADTTAVHVFDRDEDFDTPPEDRSVSASPSPSPGRSSAEAEDGDDTSEAGSPAPRIIFLPEADSSSPGSAVGSVASADDENFFGVFGPVVSTRFIQTGRPSDSGMSEDDNHDITLDSRTFSMHYRFRNVDPSDCTANSAASIRTPDTASKGPLEELNVSEPGIKSSSGRDALTDMSMLTGNPRTFDYGKLSPMLSDVMQKIGKDQPRNSPIARVADVNPDRVLATATEEERREETSCNGNGISSNELGTVNSTEEHISVRIPVSTCTDPVQEDNVMITDGLEKFQVNSNNDHAIIDSGVNNTVEPQANLSPLYRSLMNNFETHHPLNDSLSKNQPSDSNGTAHASSMTNFDSEHHPLDQPLSKDQPPETDCVTNASQLSSADPVIFQKDAKQLHQQNKVIDTETVLLTPRTSVQQLEVPQGSISSLRSKRPKLFSASAGHVIYQNLQNKLMETETILPTPRTVAQQLEFSKGSISSMRSKRLESFSASAVPVICQEDARQSQQQNEVMDTETILRTPRTVVQQLEAPQGSISSLHSKRQKLFSSTPLSNCEASSLGIEFVKHDQRISAPENVLKLRLQESPAASQLPLVERNELGHKANDIFRNAEDHAPAMSVSCNSVSRRQLKRTGESSITGTTPGQGLNEAANVQNTSCDVITLDSQLSCDLDSDGGGRKRSIEEDSHAVHEHPDETSKAARSPKKSRKQLTSASELSVLPKVFEKQCGDNDNSQSVNVDRNKVVCTISNAIEQVLAASISKLNFQQLDTLGDKLDDIQMAQKYRRLSTAVRVKDWCGDQQKRLAEARSLHERLLYERAKLQINNMKLAKLRNKAQQCEIGIQECSFLKSKISYAVQMNNASFHFTSLIKASDRQEGLAVVTKKRLEYNNIQQKVESLKSSLEYFRKTKGEISCQNVMKSAEEQLDMRNQCRSFHQLAGLPKLMDIVKRDNKHDVILNYRNLLFQRIILNISDRSSIFVNNSLNGNKIGQTFPDLDASVAFNYVFKAEENHRVTDLQSLQKMTMETRLLLGNLVDVLDEIKFAKMKLLNLTSAAFVLESQTCQLALRLCFMSFKSGKRIAFTIDMTHLNRSVYPSEPSELLIKLYEAQTTLSQPSIEETMVSIRNLQPGRTMMLRLCQMVSQLIESL
ncbi:hypothetical protein EJB05_41519 [Eragrostis curvula]|uniref:Spc7 kinetochore protein domain-containing protein n=1 Tax=Eragrostis curvula TaxID=38414 RepID=A0A5J9TC17_9POAL|nr:hypothetical protein EJB05_41519 [Eragrostis curvula]